MVFKNPADALEWCLLRHKLLLLRLLEHGYMWLLLLRVHLAIQLLLVTVTNSPRLLTSHLLGHVEDVHIDLHFCTAKPGKQQTGRQH
jgi:hypothetical protein